LRPESTGPYHPQLGRSRLGVDPRLYPTLDQACPSTGTTGLARPAHLRELRSPSTSAGVTRSTIPPRKPGGPNGPQVATRRSHALPSHWPPQSTTRPWPGTGPHSDGWSPHHPRRAGFGPSQPAGQLARTRGSHAAALHRLGLLTGLGTDNSTDQEPGLPGPFAGCALSRPGPATARARRTHAQELPPEAPVARTRPW
jgi:hypothetical protein